MNNNKNKENKIIKRNQRNREPSVCNGAGDSAKNCAQYTQYVVRCATGSSHKASTT